MNIVLIGAGALGSRHLQGILKLTVQSAVYVVDPSKESLLLAKQRAEEIKHDHALHFFEHYSNLPKHIDFCIVATNANVRLKVLETLLPTFSIKYLILEKILFQKIADYKKALDLLTEFSVATWVNHPLRINPLFAMIKKEMRENKGPFHFNVYGKKWGIGCNALHWLDLIEFLRDSPINNINCDGLESFFESKRSGFLEFSGTARASLMNGDSISISDDALLEGASQKESLSIVGLKTQWVIEKGESLKCIRFSNANFENPEVTTHPKGMQSELTATVIHQIQSSGHSDLPKFENASKTHSIWISALLTYMNKDSIEKTIVCPIT